MIIGDYLLLLAIGGALRYLQADVQQVGQFLQTVRDLDPQRYQQAVQWFSANIPTVQVGWLTDPPPPAQAFVSITLGGQTETDQYIGSDFSDEFDEDEDGNHVSLVHAAGSLNDVTFDVDILALNQNLTIWVSQAVWWALKVQRDILALNGLESQRMQMADLSLDQNLTEKGGVFVFSRRIRFMAKAPDLVATTSSNFLRQVNLTVIDPRDPTHPALP